MYYFKCLIAFLLGLAVVIPYAGAAAYFVTPYSPWFLLLKTPVLAAPEGIHSALWFCFYLITAYIASKAVVFRDKCDLIKIATIVISSLLYTAVLFALQQLWWATLPLVCATIAAFSLSFSKRSGAVNVLLACWYIYLLATHYGYLMLN